MLPHLTAKTKAGPGEEQAGKRPEDAGSDSGEGINKAMK